MRRTRLGAGGLGRVKGQLGQEAAARRIAPGNLLQLIEIGCAGTNIVVQALEMRQIPLTNQSDLPRPGRRFVTQPAKERTELRPVRGGRWRRCESIQQSEVPAGSGQMCQRIPRRCGADTWQQLQHAEAGDGVSRVLDPAQHAQHVLDMRRLKEL
jgi:hypothetical protein